MKKQLYLFLALTLSASVAFAQSSRESQQYITKKGFVDISQPNKSKAVNAQKGTELILWEDDFSDPDLWDTYDESTPEPLGWEIISDVNASPVAALNPIMLTTAENGFAFINGDPAGDGSNQNAYIEYNTDFNLSGADNVSLVFEQNTRNFATTYFVDFSIDGGTSWIPVQVNVNLETNTNTANPEVTTVPVGDIVGGEDNVRLRFHFLADWGWHWAVDDVRIIETPPYDVVLNAAYYDEYILIGQTDYLDTDYVPNLEYREYRQNHVRPFTFVADITNQGSDMVTGLTFQATVTTPDDTEVFTGSIDELPSGMDTVISIEDEMLAAFMDGGVIGDYTVDFEIAINEDDALPENNFAPSKIFSVGTEKMTNDLGDFYTGWYNISQAVIWGNQFTVEEETEVNYIQFALVDATDDPTVIGEEVFVNLRSGSVLEAEGPENEMQRYFDEDELSYVIQEGDVSIDGEVNYITIFFPEDETVTLEPGVVYQAEFEVPEVGSPIATIPVSNSQEAGAGVFYDFLDVSGGPQGWWTIGANTPNVRAGFSTSVNTNDRGSLNFRMEQNFPNPVANGSTRISWELLESAENVTFNVTDNTGKIIYQKDLGDRPAGVQEDIVLNNLKLAAGVYQYGLKVGNQRIVRKMVITK